MEIKPVTVVNAGLIPGIRFEFCGTVKRYIEALNYYEIEDEAASVSACPDIAKSNKLNAVLTHNDDDVIVVTYFGDPFVEALTTTRKYHSLVSQAVARLSHTITANYVADFAWAGELIADTNALADRISDVVNEVIWNYCDSLIAKHKEKNAEGKTPKKRGRKPKADKAVAGSEKPSSEGSSEQGEQGPTENNGSGVSPEVGKSTGRKKPGPKPKTQTVEEAPKKHRGRPRKAAESFEEQPSTETPGAEEEAAREAEEIPVEGQEEAAAQIDFGL